jgi:uncharacterized protein YjbI with pentapeptide repeats/beta-lactamase regulating signal transducer with metallopeptidase domain
MIDWHQGFVTVATALAAIALNALWQDALLVLCVWLFLRAWPRINAATRYIVWSATLVAAFVLPVATTLTFFTPGQAIVTTSAANEASRPFTHRTVAQPRQAATSHAVLPPQEEGQARLPERMRLTVPEPVALGVFAIWFVLAAYALVRLAIGLMRLEQLKRDALPLPVEYRDAMPQWLRANKGARDVRLCVSDETDVPVAVGLFDAMILIPHSLLDRLSEPEVDQICLHELAHLRRGDDWTNGFQRVVSALLGWNPAALFIGQQLDLEREVACDDWVLSFVGTVRPYALCLTKMAESALWPRHPIPAPGVFATRKHISLRIERLLAAGRNIATGLAVGPAAAAVGVVGAIAIVIGFVAPSVAAPSVVATTTPAHTAVVASTETAAPQRTAAPVKARTVFVTKPVTKTETIVKVIHVPTAATPHAAPSAASPAAPAAPPAPPKQSAWLPALPRIDTTALAKSVASSVAQAESSGGVQGSRTCSGCDFGRVDWSGRDMRGVSYVGVDLSKSRLVGTNFSGGNFNGVDFTKADLRNASFRNAHLVGCDFSDADLTGVDFTGVKLNGCQFTGARLNASELRDVLNSCNGCDFSRASMSDLDLSNVRASGDDFTRADLRGVNFAGAHLTGIDFSGAHLDGANFAGAVLNGCDVSGVDLTHVDLSKATLIGMDFSSKKPQR